MTIENDAWTITSTYTSGREIIVEGMIDDGENPEPFQSQIKAIEKIMSQMDKKQLVNFMVSVCDEIMDQLKDG